MVRVEVQNFQSIQDGAVDIDGFSVVVGRSNIGKSALVRAIKAALTGAPAENFVRHVAECTRSTKGAKSCKCFCSVRIKGKGVDLLWEKGDAVNRYVFNGTEHTVVGKGTPSFLGEAFAPIQIGGDTTATLLQVADQFRPLFILDRSGTAVADVLSDVAKLDQINEASRQVERDRRECVATRKVRDKDLQALDGTLQLYEGLDAVVQQVRAVEAMSDALAVQETRVQTMARLAQVFTSATESIGQLRGIEEIEIFAPVEILGLHAKVETLRNWERVLDTKRQALASLEKAANVVAPDGQQVADLGERYWRLQGWRIQLGAIKAVFTRFKGAEEAVVPLIDGLEPKQRRYRTISSWAADMSGIQAALTGLQGTLATAEAEEADVMQAFKALEVCPTCRQPVNLADGLHEESCV